MVQPAIGSLQKLRLYKKFLEFIRMHASRELVLVLFILPFILGEALGIISGILAVKLYIVSAFIIYICKIPLVIIAFAILENGKEKLLSYTWFKLLYTWITAQLTKLHHYPLYIQTIQKIKTVTSKIKFIISSVMNKVLKKIKKHTR